MVICSFQWALLDEIIDIAATLVLSFMSRSETQITSRKVGKTIRLFANFWVYHFGGLVGITDGWVLFVFLVISKLLNNRYFRLFNFYFPGLRQIHLWTPYVGGNGIRPHIRTCPRVSPVFYTLIKQRHNHKRHVHQTRSISVPTHIK